MSVLLANGGSNNYQGNANGSGAGVTCANASSTGNYLIIGAIAGQVPATMNTATLNDGTTTYSKLVSSTADFNNNDSMCWYGGVIGTGLAGGYVIKSSIAATFQVRIIELVITGTPTVDNGGLGASGTSNFTTGGTMATGNLVNVGANGGKIFTVGFDVTAALTIVAAGGATSLGIVNPSTSSLSQYLDYATAGTYTGQMTDPTGGTSQGILSVALYGATGGSAVTPQYISIMP